ncbi:DUF1237 domain-containing protein [Taphrina deformans PYCC 5710]|uniref:DUF1237 domain-containing protein n=1 Tax=Taphrina deformans (strain PYCC 5710 / ATCC 11124 / CBS 356.35 / IMI 108563 / JCM 9778 / NBRC 8474) TaxID=1097556 RepID=R4XA56_TAPDE|nr:DUF1237 domain-containing protein [Taphrina deformans PYCC 5710]|eukprot:CCG81154.1 DUF1237 domain-containing protein [Taphrina deformans PYCC 5710]
MVKIVTWGSCTNYLKIASEGQEPRSAGRLGLAQARPLKECRTFTSDVVEQHIQDVSNKIGNPDLRRLFENCYVNTLDTSISYNRRGDTGKEQTFVISGDIDAMWIRDSAQQLHVYRKHIAEDKSIAALFRGVINTQVEYLVKHPYCNAFQAPLAAQRAGILIKENPLAKDDIVHPKYDEQDVYECKFQLDSVASFLQISVDYFEAMQDPLFFDDGWLDAVKTLLSVVEHESMPTFSPSGTVDEASYRYQRPTTSASGTLNNNGYGNPVNKLVNGTLVRSAFRPSNAATSLQYLIPSNAYLAVMLEKAAEIASSLIVGHETMQRMQKLAGDIRIGIERHGIVQHPSFGQVYAFEVDGYGGSVIMDEASFPNLIGLPLMDFVSSSNAIYENTRKLALSREGNPYYFERDNIKGIGSPSTGIGYIWPLSLLVAMQTSQSKSEVGEYLAIVLNSTAGMGLMHESINISNTSDYTRAWFGMANSMLGSTIEDVLTRFPGVIAA